MISRFTNTTSSRARTLSAFMAKIITIKTHCFRTVMCHKALLTTLVTSSPCTTAVKTDYKTVAAHSSRKIFIQHNTLSPNTSRYICSLMLLPPFVHNSILKAILSALNYRLIRKFMGYVKHSHIGNTSKQRLNIVWLLLKTQARDGKTKQKQQRT